MISYTIEVKGHVVIYSITVKGVDLCKVMGIIVMNDVRDEIVYERNTQNAKMRVLESQEARTSI